tara:strand:+ start:2956 stop:3576 length:621 start_codon:yes stop_codon:yes gene_type:complete
MNPDFKLEYYDDKRCRDIIQNNFKKEVLYAYDNLVPGAYKADLFRYCILYLYGGVYSDLTQIFKVPFNEIIDFKKDKLVLVEDAMINNCRRIRGIQINFIASYPRENIFLQAIDKIIKNVKNNYYGECSLSPTGPLLFRRVYELYGPKARIELIQKKGENAFVYNKLTGKIIYFNKSSDHNININKNKSNNYDTIWKNGGIYNNHL